MIAINDAGDKEYGGLVILKHQTELVDFYTLYGHLSVKSATKNKVGDLLKKGCKIGNLGNYSENGNWAPHLHFQVLLSLLDFTSRLSWCCLFFRNGRLEKHLSRTQVC